VPEATAHNLKVMQQYAVSVLIVLHHMATPHGLHVQMVKQSQPCRQSVYVNDRY
jgi:hypothetical protein